MCVLHRVYLKCKSYINFYLHAFNVNRTFYGTLFAEGNKVINGTEKRNLKLRERSSGLHYDGTPLSMQRERGSHRAASTSTFARDFRGGIMLALINRHTVGHAPPRGFN